MTLTCPDCRRTYPVTDGVPPFVERESYASFGIQGTRFRREQLDSINSQRFSRNRLFSETEWPEEWLRGSWILDAGCGAGRFLDVLANHDCNVVGST